uniref:NADH-ubiquinone oxidoreductase chain 1 n=1 Tax=Botrylloides giganteus TaxID=2034436 RepID=A0A024GX50_9ASCI|nr:NADH dehydrogenase subunit 1 [Botrylloides giganteus]CCO25722.1 NADH dehydrogenase subunit 1 [Botrylloides giganteus]
MIVMVVGFVILFLMNLNFLLFMLFLLLMVAFLVLYERKLLGILQERKGPNVVGVFGVLQTVMDGIKLLCKGSYENYMSYYFLFLPVFGMTLSFCHWLVLPVPFEAMAGNFTVLVSFVLMGLLVYVVLGCGYVSGSAYGVIGSLRSVAQMISYEVVFMFFILGFLFFYGGYSWKLIFCYGMLEFSFLKGAFFVIWMVISSAELNRTPFDLVEGESELVSGYNVEFSGYNFTLLFLSEYMNIWFMGVLFGVLFSSSLGGLLGFSLLFVSLNVLMRGLLPRYKFVDLINLMWKVFLPFVFLFLLFYLFLSCG